MEICSEAAGQECLETQNLQASRPLFAGHPRVDLLKRHAGTTRAM
jgi:hypothetical protein